MAASAATLANIDESIANVAALIADVTSSPKPTYTDQGRTVGWTEYLEALQRQLDSLQKTRQLLSGPVRVGSYGAAQR